MIYVTDPEVVALVDGWRRERQRYLAWRRKELTWRIPGRLRLAQLRLFVALGTLSG